MKKITLLFWVMMMCITTSHAQLFTITECLATVDSSVYGPMYSTSTAGAASRTAALYPSSQLAGIAGQTLNTLYYKRMTAAGTMAGTPNFKVYVKEVSVTDFGSGALDWATEIATATLIYDSNPASIVGSNAGWKAFPMLTNFVYSGTQNLAVFTEYVNTTASSSIGWAYEYQGPCIDTSNSNTGKYANNTSGTPAATLTSSNYRRAVIGFDFVTTCNAPNNISASNLTTTSADISWIENGNQPQNGYEYYYSTTNTLPASPSGTTNNGVATVSLNSLLPGTTYYFWVRGNCSTTEQSNVVGPFAFTTICSEVTSFYENFDSGPTGTGNLPNCWSKDGSSNSIFTSTGAVSPMSPANRLYMSITATTTAYALMPPVSNLQANTHRLRFKAYATSANKELRVGYFATPNTPSSFVTVSQLAMPSTGIANTLDFFISPTGIPAGVNQLVFNVVEGTSTTIYIDDVYWEAIPSCLEPTLLNVISTTSTSANLGWTVNGTETLWDIEYGPAGFTQGSGTIVAANSNPFTVNGLLSNTNYDFYVRAACSTSDLSPWTGPVSAKTLCAEVTDFVENFDTWPTGSGNLPDCWSKLGTTTTVYTQNGATSPMSPSNRLYMTVSTTTTALAVLPPVSNLQANTHRLKFKAYCTSNNRFLNLGYLTIPGDETSFVSIESMQLPGITVSTTQEFTVIPTGIPAGINQLVFSLQTGASSVVYIDDVKWEVNSSCLEPTLLTSSAYTNTSATLGWTNGGSETMWEIEYGLTGFSIGSGTIVNSITANPYVLNGLLSNTSYDYYVRAVCSGPTESAWSGPHTFKTSCDEVTTFSEGFEGYATGTANPLADCWTRLGNASVYITTGATAPMSPANRLYMTANGMTPTESLAVMPPVSNLQANTHRLKFKSFATTTSKFIEVGYVTDASDASSFVLIQEVFLPGTTVSTTQEFTIIPGVLPAGVKHLCFRNPGNPSGTTTLYIDDVIWEAIPSCIEPSLLMTSNITNNSVSVSWTEGGSATNWEIEYGPVGFTQGTGTVVSTNSNPFTINSLTANTTYEFYVRAICSTTDNSTWTGPSSFMTQCNDVTEFSENFDTYASGSANPLADCWRKGGTGSVYLTTGATAPMSPSIRLYLFASSTANPLTESYAIMPSVSNLQADTHRLRFKSYATLADRVLEVGYMTDPSDLSTFVSIQNVTLPSANVASTQEFYIIPTGIPAGVKNLAFKNPGYTSSSATIYIDDVIWEAIPACPLPINLSASAITSNSAELSWTEMGSATTWNIEYGPTGYTQGSGTLISGVTSNPYTLGSISPDTTFDYYVQAACGGTAGVSLWSGPYTFTTLCLPIVAPYTENFDGLALVTPYTALPNCWEAQTGPDYWDVTNDVTNAGNTYAPNVGDHTTGSSNYMWIDSSSDITANQMVTPFIDISGLTSPYASFWFLSQNTNNSINHTIALDVWNGSSWLNIATQTGNFPTWVQVGAAIPSSVPTTTQFRIYAIANPNGNSSDYFYNDLGVDDFAVGEASVLSTNASLDLTEFVAYPNPVNDILHLSYSSEIKTVQVINLLGQELISKSILNNTGTIDFSNFSAGTYIVRVSIGDVIKSIKINKK